MKLRQGKEAKQAIKQAVNIMADMVKTSLGPKGNYVIINRGFEGTLPTKDGVSIANEIESEDAIEDSVFNIVRQSSQKMLKKAGDGSTSTLVFLQAIYNLGYKNIMAGANATDLREGMKIASKEVYDFIEKNKTKVTKESELINIATISCNGDEELGKLIGETFYEIGVNGNIDVYNSSSNKSYVEKVSGAQFDQGFISPHFITEKESEEVILDNPLIFISDKDIKKWSDIETILNVALVEKRSLLLIVSEIDDRTLNSVIANKTQGILNVCIVKCPGFGDHRHNLLEDLSALTGAKVLSEQSSFDFSEVLMEHFGESERVKVSKEDTIITEGLVDENKLKNRLNTIDKQLEKELNPSVKEKLNERKANLSGGIAVIYCGASTEAELTEKKDRVDDAVHATRAAMEEGIVPGGGSIYLKIDFKGVSKDLNRDVEVGYQIIKEVMSEPLKTILFNAGIKSEVIINKVANEKINFGYDAKLEEYCDMIQNGIVDPAKVSRLCFENGLSIASILLQTNGIIAKG